MHADATATDTVRLVGNACSSATVNSSISGSTRSSPAQPASPACHRANVTGARQVEDTREIMGVSCLRHTQTTGESTGHRHRKQSHTTSRNDISEDSYLWGIGLWSCLGREGRLSVWHIGLFHNYPHFVHFLQKRSQTGKAGESWLFQTPNSYDSASFSSLTTFWRKKNGGSY